VSYLSDQVQIGVRGAFTGVWPSPEPCPDFSAGSRIHVGRGMNETFTIEHRGCRLSYNVRGDGPRCCSFKASAFMVTAWRPQVDGLASHYPCLTFDNRGMGRSQPIGAPLSIERMAEDALVLMDAQGWESAHVVGHSLGGLIALHLALSARNRVRSLSLLCTFARGRDATRPSPWMIWTGLRTRIGTRRQRRHAFLKLMFPPEALAISDRDALAARLVPSSATTR